MEPHERLARLTTSGQITRHVLLALPSGDAAVQQPPGKRAVAVSVLVTLDAVKVGLDAVPRLILGDGSGRVGAL